MLYLILITATQIWELAEGKCNSIDFAEAIDNSDLEDFGFTDEFVIELWGAVTDARAGRHRWREDQMTRRWDKKKIKCRELRWNGILDGIIRKRVLFYVKKWHCLILVCYHDSESLMLNASSWSSKSPCLLKILIWFANVSKRENRTFDGIKNAGRNLQYIVSYIVSYGKRRIKI